MPCENQRMENSVILDTIDKPAAACPFCISVSMIVILQGSLISILNYLVFKLLPKQVGWL